MYGITRDPEDWITEIKLLRGNLQILIVIIDNLEVMTHILSNLPEKYENIIENIDDGLDDGIDTLTIERIRDNSLAKYDQMTAQSETKNSREDENALYIKSYPKGTCNNRDKYGHNNRDCKKGKDNKYCTYCKNDAHEIQYCYIKNIYGQE